jgi:hypothetical protein
MKTATSNNSCSWAAGILYTCVLYNHKGAMIYAATALSLCWLLHY